MVTQIIVSVDSYSIAIEKRKEKISHKEFWINILKIVHLDYMFVYNCKV
jgi:hypothetical protein